MVSIIDQDKMMLAFAGENRLSHDSEACPSNLSSSTAGSSTDTNISADDMAALQAATAKVMSGNDHIVGASGGMESDNEDGKLYYRIQQSSSLMIRQAQQQQAQQQSSQSQIHSTNPSQPSGESTTNHNTGDDPRDEPKMYTWTTTMSETIPIVDQPMKSSQVVNDAANRVTSSMHSNLSMRDLFEDEEAMVQYQKNQKVDALTTDSSIWFPLGDHVDDDDDDDPSRGSNLTPSCSSGQQTPQNHPPQRVLPSPPSTLSQFSLMQEHLTMNTPAAPPLPLIDHSGADTGLDLSVATVGGSARQDNLRAEQHVTAKAAPINTNNPRRPVLYSAIGSLENASMHSWNKRLLANAAKKASPFVTNRKSEDFPSSSTTLLPPNQWVPLTHPKVVPASTTFTSQQENSHADGLPALTSTSSSLSSSYSRQQPGKQQSLASVLAAAEEAAKSSPPQATAVASPTSEITARPDGRNNGLSGNDPEHMDHQSQSCDFGVNGEITGEPSDKLVSTQPQHPILTSALRPSRLKGKSHSDEQKQHKRPHSMWGLNMFEDKNTGKHVTLEESPATSITKKKKKKKKKVVEMFRPSCDAYTPQINTEKRTIKYKPAQERRAMMSGGKSEDMGTLSRPNFRDALRRVAMIVHQHVVKIQHRVEDQGGLQNTGLFTAEMKEAFSEERFVTPRYKCTMVRVPMSRPGMVYGLRKIKVRYEIPTESEIYEFAHRLFQKVQLSSECSIVGLIYVERLMEIAKVPLLADTWRPIFLCGLLLASKVWQDLSSWNIEFASVYPQFSLKAIHQLELQFLRMVKWDLYISSSLYAKYYFALRSLVEKRDFRQRYNRMVGGVGSVDASEALKIQKRTELIKEEALLQLSRSM